MPTGKTRKSRKTRSQDLIYIIIISQSGFIVISNLYPAQIFTICVCAHTSNPDKHISGKSPPPNAERDSILSLKISALLVLVRGPKSV